MATPQPALNLPKPFLWVSKHRHLLVPISFLAMLIVLVVPLPPAIMDLLISGTDGNPIFESIWDARSCASARCPKVFSNSSPPGS